MDIHEVKARIKEIIFETTNIKVETINDDTLFKQDLELDSLTLMEIAVNVDQEYDLDLPEEEFDKLTNVETSAQMVLQYKASQAVGS